MTAILLLLALALARSSGHDAVAPELRVAVMNDHASALGVWLSTLHPRNPPAVVAHIDRHSDLAVPRHCRFPCVQRWESCVDRAGFQLAAAWLGLVDRIWWLRPGGGETFDSVWSLGLSRNGWPEVVAKGDTSDDVGTRSTPKLAVREGPLVGMDELRAWRSPLGEREHSDDDVPHILDVDLDFWGGSAGPLPPPWEMPPLQSCGALLRLQGAAAWAAPRLGTHAHLWAPLLRELPLSAAAQQELACREECLLEEDCELPLSNRTLLELCADQLTQFAQTSSAQDRRRLRRAHDAGLSVPEALLSVARTHQGEQCGVVDEVRLAEMLRPLRPRVVTIARSVDGYMPWRCAERLEAAIVRVLRLAYNRSLHLDYLPGTVQFEVLGPLRSLVH